MIVVLDTNIWLQELGLNSSAGAAVRFFLRHQRAQLAVPEVIRLEVEQNFRATLTDYVSTIEQNHRQLLAVFGKLKEMVLPDHNAIDAKVAEIFSGVGVELLDAPFSLASARSSLLKCIAKRPPSKNQQQFKDGVLWADCVSFLQRDEVYLVTADTDFYEDYKYDKGLARNLRDESVGLPHSIKVFRSLAELLSELKKTEVTLDEDLLARTFMERNKTNIERTLDEHRFRPEGVPSVQKSLYATEDAAVLYINFSIVVPCVDTTDQGRKEAFLLLKGDGRYNAATQSYLELNIHRHELKFRLANGTEGVATIVQFMSGNIVLGHKDVTHTVRYELTG